MDKKAFVIVDNTDTSITYNGPSDFDWWYYVPNDNRGLWYLGSQHSPLVVGVYNMSVDIVFEGRFLAMYGIGTTSPPSFHLPPTVTIDVNTSSSLQLPTPEMASSIQKYGQFFQTPTLEEGRHTVHLENPNWEALDFLLIGVGPNTNLDGKVLWVDNEDPQIEYVGTSWRRNSALLDGSFPTHTTPVGNSTHQASIPGDILSFKFCGTAVSVYATYSWQNISLLSFVFTLDGATHPISFSVTDFMEDYINQKSDGTNFLLFEANNLTAAPHALIVNLTRVENTTFRFDYLTYKPSFSTLSTMPDLSLSPSPSAVAPSPTFSLRLSVAGTIRRRGLPPGILGACVAASVLFIFTLTYLAYRIQRRRKSLQPRQCDSVHQTDRHLPPVPPTYSDLPLHVTRATERGSMLDEPPPNYTAYEVQ